MTTKNSQKTVKLRNGRRISRVAPTDPVCQRLNEHFDRLEKKFDTLELGLASLRKEMIDGLDRLIFRLDELNGRMERFLQKYTVRPADSSVEQTSRPD